MWAPGEIVGTALVVETELKSYIKKINDDLLLVMDVERDVAQWLERGALPMSLPAVRFRIPLGAGFSEKYHVSPLSILGHYFFDVVSLGKTLYPHMLHLTQV